MSNAPVSDVVTQDLRIAVRSLVRRPFFTGVVLLTFALGVGANTAIFSVANAILIEPLPYSHPDQLVQVFETYPPNGDLGGVAPANLNDWQAQSTTFAQLAGYRWTNLTAKWGASADQLVALRATPNFFTALGVRPLAGRFFASGDGSKAWAQTIVVSEAFALSHFATASGALGRTVTLGEDTYTIVGVMPEWFQFPAGYSGTDVWIPLSFSPAELSKRGVHDLNVIGRLKPNATREGAEAEMRTIAARLQRIYPSVQQGRSVHLTSLRDQVIGPLRPTLIALLGAAALLLVITCTNIAGLFLAREASRSQEMAIRSALGAARGRLARQVVVEGFLLALAGAILALLLALEAASFLRSLGVSILPRADAIALNGKVFAFLFVVSLLTGIAFSVVPALMASRADLQAKLKLGSPGSSTSVGQQWSRRVLASFQIAVALILLSGAGLLLRTLVRFHEEDLGFQPGPLIDVHVALAKDKYGTSEYSGFCLPALERVMAVPGVEAAGWISKLPILEWGTNSTFLIAGRPPAAAGDAPLAEQRVVSAGYFRAMGIPIVQGRNFASQDRRNAPLSVVVNETFAKKYFPGQSPIGRQLLLSGVTLTIIGEAGDVRQAGLDRNPLPEVDFSLSQLEGLGFEPSMHLVVRSAVPPDQLAGALRAAIASTDPNQAIVRIQTLDDVVRHSVADRRLYFCLLGAFAFVAVILATAGIFGVTTHFVAQRVREIGIRMALGATPESVARMVLAQGLWIASVGVAIGLTGAVLLTSFLKSMLYGTAPTDPATLSAVVAIVVASALAASYLPARRAARLAPMNAVKSE
ncbi:MAG TPA: ABC transporter permease [Gemmatimonadaceae bacterium]